MYIITMVVALAVRLSFAAPIPATSSSALIGSGVGRFLSEYGFSINSGSTAWVQGTSPKGIPNLATVYRSPKMQNGVQASLSVRVDRLNESKSLKSYVKHWVKDYSRLGFEILTSKNIAVNGQEGFLVDVINREASKQLRQIVFMREKIAVVLTCRDHRDTFEKTLNDCNEIVRQFHWHN